MTAADLLAHLKADGFSVTMENARTIGVDPGSLLTDEERALLRRYTRDILRLLQQRKARHAAAIKAGHARRRAASTTISNDAADTADCASVPAIAVSQGSSTALNGPLTAPPEPLGAFAQCTQAVTAAFGRDSEPSYMPNLGITDALDASCAEVL